MVDDRQVSLQVFLEGFTQAAIVVLAALTLANWWRWHDAVSRDIFLVFGTLACLFAVERLVQMAGVEAAWVQPLGASVLLAHPYLLLRVITHFRRISVPLRRFAEVGLAVSLASIWTIFGLLRSPLVVAFAVVYFIGLLAYVAWIFSEGGRSTRGVTRWRMRHAALGAALLAVVFVLAAVIGLLPASRVVLGALVPLAALGAAVNYYFAFAPPAWLRRLWQSSELYEFLASRDRDDEAASEETLLNRLSGFVVPAIGATGAAAALWDDTARQLLVRVSRWGYLEPGRPVPEGRLLDAWRADRALLVKEYEWVLPGGAPGSVYVVPIHCKVAPRGLLFVVLPKAALFESDDLALLRVCCDEAAVQLDNATLRARQAALIKALADRGDQLAAANKELEAFSYSVSHDLRAPLRHIGGFSELLLKSPGPELGPARERYLKVIAESASKMGELIDALLVFSRMGRTEMLHTRVDLNHLVRAVQRDIVQSDPTRAVDWTIGELPVVSGDAAMLRLVFTNLLSNAFKYSRNRETAAIEVGANVADSEVVVFVKDNGVGFDMAYATRLFGVFQRLHRGEEFEGTGIGLANAQRIVGRHGGRVWAEAELGKGATFYVSLPLG